MIGAAETASFDTVSEVIRTNHYQSLWKETSLPVELEVPIPGEYWASFDQSGEWITIAERDVKVRGSIRIVKSLTGEIMFGALKATRSSGESL